MSETCDFSGWATRYNVPCTDGRTILNNAFKECDGRTVPLVWNHDHSDPFHIVGRAKLRHCDEGVRADCWFNNTEAGQYAKEVVKHKDICKLSICANHLAEKAYNGLRHVANGLVQEVSLVIGGANPQAYIDYVMEHSDEDGDTAYICTYDGSYDVFFHNDEEDEKEESKVLNADEFEMEHADDEKKQEEKKAPAKDIEAMMDAIEDKLDEDEMNLIYGLIGMAAEEGNKKQDDDEEEKEMKHNIFEGSQPAQANVLSHSDGAEIIELAKKAGSLKDAIEYYAEENDTVMMHADSAAPVGGFTQDTSVEGNITYLFPDYKDLKSGAPELITDDQSWQNKVISKTHKLPFSRIRTGQVDIRNIDALRAKGYEKGKFKKYSGNFKLVRRTHDPQTIYVKNALHKDDITDITDFDYVQYLYNIDRMMLNNEIATAILFGDGRDEDDADKIYPEHIRPVWLDDDLYTIHADLDLAAARQKIQGTNTSANFSENYILAEAFIEKLLYTREKFKGTGTPDLYITPHMVNVMLLSRDMNGRRIYSSINELKAALNVNEIITVEQMENLTRVVGSGTSAKTKKLDALLVNLTDYAIGSTKGGEISHFTQFDIHFNQQLSLIETRLSGALTKCWSAIAIEEEVTSTVEPAPAG